MTHWFDRLSVRASEGEPAFSRRTAVKTAASAAVSASPLGAPLLARASEVRVQLRDDACRCQAEADQVAIDNNKRLLEIYATGGLFSGFVGVLVVAGLAGTLAGWTASKLACGPCRRNPSGSLSGGGGGGTPCRARGGTCPGPGPSCPSGTSPCADGLCCFGSDVCCSCGAEATCCIVEIGCTCC